MWPLAFTGFVHGVDGGHGWGRAGSPSLAERTLEVMLDGIFQQNWALLKMG